MWVAQSLGAPLQVRIGPVLASLLWINLWLLLWRVAMRALFTGSDYGLVQGLLSVPRLIVGNVIAICAAGRALSLYIGRAPRVWDKTRHTFPAEYRS